MTRWSLPLALLAACGAPATDDADDTDVDAVFTAANTVPEGDPLYEGQQQFLHDTWGTEVLGQWPPAAFLLQLQADQPDVFGDQFAKFGFVRDPGDDLPVGLKRGVDDPEEIHETCAMCHVAELPDGTMWMGAPNVKLEIGRFRAAVNDAWVDAGNPPLMTDLEREKALKLGPGRTNAETSTYAQVVAVDFPPYYQLGERTALNYMGTGKDVRTEVHFAIYSFGAGQSDEVPFPSDRVQPFIDFLGALQAPPAPAQDSTAVARGAEVFDEARCGECHHVDDVSLDGDIPIDRSESKQDRYPGDDPEWPDGSIATSDLHRVLQDGDGEGGGGADDFTDLVAFIVQQGLVVGQTDGYRPSSLRGLWASAPFLHNGSVPTLEDLLAPPESRPASWERDGFPIDTTARENQNHGHTFGTDLSSDDKTALVAYLKSL